jgi:hypothetical protein
MVPTRRVVAVPGVVRVTVFPLEVTDVVGWRVVVVGRVVVVRVVVVVGLDVVGALAVGVGAVELAATSVNAG